MEYVEKTLKVKIEYCAKIQPQLPRAIATRYDLDNVVICGVKAVFVYPKTELEQLASVKKQISIIAKAVAAPVVLILNVLNKRQRDALIADMIPFVVKDSQIYLPFLGIVLSERFTSLVIKQDKLTPSAQLVLLYYLLQAKKKLYLREMQDKLKLSAMSLSRAAKQIAGLNILETGKDGVQKYIYSEKHFREVFTLAKSAMEIPVRKTVYIDKTFINESFVVAGESALAVYSMLNDPRVAVYATDSISETMLPSDELLDSNNQVAVQIWKYNPSVLAANGVVDRLSLAVSFDENDERIEAAVEEMLQKLWEENNG